MSRKPTSTREGQNFFARCSTTWSHPLTVIWRRNAVDIASPLFLATACLFAPWHIVAKLVLWLVCLACSVQSVRWTLGEIAEYYTKELLRVVLDECPWPRDVWPATLSEVGSRMRSVFGDADITAMSGTLMRHGWECARKRVIATMEAPSDVKGPKSADASSVSREAEKEKDLEET